ncbi:MAG: phosphopentomutase [Thermoleophilaceae bacterium]
MLAERRAFVVVIDACGVGALPDAQRYGDEGANTLAHVAEAVGGLELPTLASMGLGNVGDFEGVVPAERPGIHGRLHPLGPGKDTSTGHWEMMGIRAPPAPVYPHGFPAEVIARFERVTGRRVIGNAALEGVGAIDMYGERQLETGELIVYTSQDSVFQIAAHTAVVSESDLYGYCAAAREILRGDHAVGRVIARPFEGAVGAFRRTAGRRDFALEPPVPNYLDELAAAGVPVHSVGKVGQVFAGRGIAFDHPAPDNQTALGQIDRLLAGLDRGFVFANLIDTDQVYGHRKDTYGFHAALRTIDASIARWLGLMRPHDLLVICADHGCDPAQSGSDHTREYAPLLATYAGAPSHRADGPLASIGASVLAWTAGRRSTLPGEAFVPVARS